MTGIYTIIDGQVYLQKEAVKLCPSISLLDQNQIKFLISVYDYVGGPLRGQPESRRKELAASFFFLEGTDKKKQILILEKSKDFQKAIEEFVSIIYDPDKNSYDVYLDKLEQVNTSIRSCDPKDIAKFMNAATQLRTEIDRLKLKIERQDVATINIELKGGRKLSLLEEWRRRREQYNRMNVRQKI
jgi:hypothetical protein